MRENPTKRPYAPTGIRLWWVRGVYKIVGRGRNRRRIVIRKGHWRRSFEKGKEGTRRGWRAVLAFRHDLEREWGLIAADPVFKKNALRDVVKTQGGHPLNGLVWERALTGTNRRGDYVQGRIWYIVEDTNNEEFYLYTRHSGPFGGYNPSTGEGRLVVGDLQSVDAELEKLRDAVRAEYEQKEYMRLRKFIAWTAWERMIRKNRKFHARRRFMSKEVGRSIVNISGRYEVAEDTTAFEADVAIELLKGKLKGTGRRLAFKTPAEFRVWLKRLSVKQRRAVRRLLAQVVRDSQTVFKDLRKNLPKRGRG